MASDERKHQFLKRMSEDAQMKKAPGFECYILYGDDYHDEVSKTFPQPRGQLHAGGQETTEEFVRDNEERLRNGCKVLDACCGEGYTVAYLAESFPNSQFVGVDIVQKAITVAMSGVQSLGNVAYVQGTIYDLPFEDESFDIVLGQDPDGLCHKDRKVALEEIYRVLKLGGTLYAHLSWIPNGWTSPQMQEYREHTRTGDMLAIITSLGDDLIIPRERTEVLGRKRTGTLKKFTSIETNKDALSFSERYIPVFKDARKVVKPTSPTSSVHLPPQPPATATGGHGVRPPSYIPPTPSGLPIGASDGAFSPVHSLSGTLAAARSAQDFLSDAEAVGFIVDDERDLTSLAKDHFKATAFLEKKVRGEADPWTRRMLSYANKGRKFGLKVVAHRETLFEMIHSEKYDAIKEVLRQKTVEDILSYRDWAKFTVLHHAAKDGKLGMVKWLIETKGLPVDIEDGNGSYPAYRAIGFGREDVTKYLMKRGTDLTHVNWDGSNLLHNTCDTGDEQFSFYLVEKGLCDPFLPSKKGNTPVSVAIGKLHNWVIWIFDSKVKEVKRFVRWRLRRYDLAFLDYGEDEDGIDSVVSKIVKRHVTDLLRHPLVYNYFALRWSAFAQRSSLIDMVLHLMDLGTYVAFTIVLPYQGRSFLHEMLTIGLCLLLIGISYKNLRKEYVQFKDSTAVYRTVLGKTMLVNEYLTVAWNFLEVFLYVVISIVALLVLCAVAADGRGGARFSDSDELSEVLMITTLLFFFRTLRFLSLFKFIGPYIQTIFRMTRELGIFFSFFLVFWAAFSLAFFVKFPESEVGSLWSILRNVLEQFILGDGDRIRDAIDDAGPVPQFVYVLMLLVMPLLLVNLVIAMLVNTYDTVQYQATEEYLVIWAKYILEMQASVPITTRNRLLRDASIRSFHAIPVENESFIDTAALARGFEFSHDRTYVWTKEVDDEADKETQAMQLFRDHFLKDVRHLEVGIAGAAMKRKGHAGFKPRLLPKSVKTSSSPVQTPGEDHRTQRNRASH